MVKLILLFLVLTSSCISNQTSKDFEINPWFHTNGYKFSFYEVRTNDNYLLTLLRVSNGRNDQNNYQNPSTNRIAVLLMHGMMSSSMDFVYGNRNSYVTRLVENGFDVFLGNTRGSPYGMGHTHLDPDNDPSFWEFSFDEIATKDLPAIVDKVLEVSGQTKISYVGHMEGSMVLFIMLSALPDYASKFNITVSLGPMAFCHNSANRILGSVIAHHMNEEWMRENIGETVFNLSGKLLAELKSDCQNSSNFENLICDNNYFLAKGYNSLDLNWETVAEALTHLPKGGSVNQLIHLAQMAESGRLQTYSPVWIGRVETNEYDLSNIYVPINVLYTSYDSLSHTKDVETLMERLAKNAKYNSFHNYRNLTNSIDFLYTKNVSLVQRFVATLLLNPFLPVNQSNTLENSSTYFSNNSSDTQHPNAGLNMQSFVKKYNYPLETHQVQTEDGYILTIFRIPHGRNEVTKRTRRPAIMLMHGLLASSIDWINTGPNRGLGFILADSGYDVWFGNQRGNINSRRHIRFDIEKDQEQFFNFTFHQIGYFDIPAMIDYILSKTGKEKIFYIGHSQGTTSFFIMASDRPEYNEKIRLMAALSPVVYMTHAKSPFLIILGALYTKFRTTSDHYYGILPYDFYYLPIARIFCSGAGEKTDLCAKFFAILSGFDYEQWDRTLSPVILSNVPAGASIGQLEHYLQLYKSERFQHFDYGSDVNMAKYGSRTPPIYDLSKVTAPIALYYGKNDWLASLQDVEELKRQLPNIVFDRLISYPKFNHMDYLWAKDVVNLLYNDLLDDLNSYLLRN